MGEAILGKAGSVPSSRTVNGKSLIENINLSAADVGASALGHGHNDTEITVNNGIVSGSLRDILTNYSIKKIFYNAIDINILNNANYPYSYETAVSYDKSPSIGLPATWWHIKYFRHDQNNGYGAQLAIGLDAGNRMMFRTSAGTSWNAWVEIYHNNNLNIESYTKVIEGVYTGNGGSQFINLGVTPKFVIVFINNYNVDNMQNQSIIAGVGGGSSKFHTIVISSNRSCTYNNVNIGQIVNGGFNVNNNDYNGVCYGFLSKSGVLYGYAAFS